MATIDKTIYNKYKNILFDFFEEETLERIMEGITKFVDNYIETNDCAYLVDDIFKNKVNEITECMNNSEYLGNMVVLGHILPEELAFLKPHEMNPEKYKNIIEKKAYELKQKKKGSTIFSCKKCKQSNCNVEQKQTRSADEPATTIVTCLECGFTFRF